MFETKNLRVPTVEICCNTISYNLITQRTADSDYAYGSAHFDFQCTSLYNEEGLAVSVEPMPTSKITADDLKEQLAVIDPPISLRQSSSAPATSSQNLSGSSIPTIQGIPTVTTI
jgi:hypothetical protein